MGASDFRHGTTGTGKADAQQCQGPESVRILSDRTGAGCGPAGFDRPGSGRAGNSASVTPVETVTGLACSGFKRVGTR